MPGTAVFLRSESDGVPHALLHNLSHNKIIHERIVFLTVHIVEVPWVPPNEQVHIEDLGHECYQLNVRFGFKDEPDIPKVMALCKESGLKFEMMETSFFIDVKRLSSRPVAGWRRGASTCLSPCRVMLPVRPIIIKSLPIGLLSWGRKSKSNVNFSAVQRRVTF